MKGERGTFCVHWGIYGEGEVWLRVVQMALRMADGTGDNVTNAWIACHQRMGQCGLAQERAGDPLRSKGRDAERVSKPLGASSMRLALGGEQIRIVKA